MIYNVKLPAYCTSEVSVMLINYTSLKLFKDRVQYVPREGSYNVQNSAK